MTRPTTRLPERGDIVLGWLTKIVVVLALFGIVGYDAISIGTTKVSLADQANTAAITASTEWQTSHDVRKAYAAAAADLAGHGATLDVAGFVVQSDNRITLRAHRTASTLVVYRIGPLKTWADVDAEGSGLEVRG